MHTVLAQPCTGQQTAEAGPDDRHVHLVGQGFAREFFIRPGILAKSGELTRDFHVLRDPVGTQPLRPLFGVLLAQHINVERAPDGFSQGLNSALRERTL
ncbi:hypothetical protein I551_5435 [Mycobacterium ulcerans str. Harvey]|uniref:Uncharacterized protein n=1 Tax=Mycobacterium ulcerans str. Harvey TaxID=1299332 RepID=A0ABN0QTK1_MYCUL|nr:hypothetical protein I551_5435 [Mycobacterium ulcerans str. Harvey]